MPAKDTPEEWIARVEAAASGGDIFANMRLKLSREEQQARQDEYKRILEESIKHLTKMGVEAVPALVASVQGPQNGALPRMSSRVLIAIGKPSINPLLEALRKSGNTTAPESKHGQRHATPIQSVFLEIGEPALTAITELIKSDKEEDRQFAVALLNNLLPPFNEIARHSNNDEDSRPTFLASTNEPIIFNALNNETDVRTKQNLVVLLGTFGADDAKVNDKYFALLKSDPDVEVRKAAASSLSHVLADESEEAAAGTIKALADAMANDSDSQVRSACALAIKSAGSKASGAIDLLRKATHDRIDNVRQSALQALCALAPTNPKCYADVETALGEHNCRHKQQL